MIERISFIDRLNNPQFSPSVDEYECSYVARETLIKEDCSTYQRDVIRTPEPTNESYRQWSLAYLFACGTNVQQLQHLTLSPTAFGFTEFLNSQSTQNEL